MASALRLIEARDRQWQEQLDAANERALTAEKELDEARKERDRLFGDVMKACSHCLSLDRKLAAATERERVLREALERIRDRWRGCQLVSCAEGGDPCTFHMSDRALAAATKAAEAKP
jgi:hypothetical protein